MHHNDAKNERTKRRWCKVEYGDNYFSLVTALEQLFHRHVDLITEITLRNPYFIQSVNKTKTPIYE